MTAAHYRPSEQLSALVLSPDPSFSASIFCSGQLTQVMAEVLAPFWREFRRQDDLGKAYLWSMRYAKCGDHLKVRVHAPEAQLHLLRQRLAAAMEEFFGALPPLSADAKRKARDLAPPIDREDWATDNYPDRTLLWTSYERSHIAFGFEPYLSDASYLALSARCMAWATETILNRLSDDPGRVSHERFQTILVNLLTAGLSVLPFSAAERALYLRYHRDWLLRAALKQSGSRSGPAKMRETLGRFNQQIEKLGSSGVRIARWARESWDSRQGEVIWPADLGGWRSSLTNLADHLLPLIGDPAYDIDPFAPNRIFLPIFKVFHNAANQLGLTHLNEAFTHHLLLSTTTEAAHHHPVQLVPLFCEAR